MKDETGHDEVVSALREAEGRRRRNALAVGAAVALLGVGAFVVSVMFSDQIFQPEIDVESGEQDVIADTNDPQCREFIARATAIGDDYRKLEPALQSSMLGNDRAEIERLIAGLEKLQDSLRESRTLAEQAELRFDNSRSEINDWFRYTQNELNLLQRVGKEQLEKLPAAAAPDAGTVVDQIEQPAPKKEAEPPKSTKTPQERLDGATLAAAEAFEKFRVWHTGGLHPCGKASEGETPWTPAADAPVVKQDGQPAASP